MVLVNSFFVLTIVVLIAISIVPFAQLVSADHISVQVSIPTGKERECVETNSCYSPSSLTIDVGSTVTWKNEDQSRHTITSGDLLQSAYNVGTNYPNGFDSPLLEIGDTWAHTFDTPGEYPYFSKAKPWMVGVVIVKTDLTAPEVVVEEGEPSPEEVIVEAETSPEEIIVEEGESESQETLPTSEPLDSEIFLDPFIFTEIGEGEPLILTGQLLTVDGMPIAEKEVYVEYMDSGGDIFFSYETTDSDGEFFSEIYFYIAGESSVFVEFEGDAEFNGTSDFIVADITFMSESASLMEEPAEPESGGGIELPSIELPSIELPSIELPSIELPSVELPGGGCLIATAAFDSEMAPQVQLLREIRDNIVLNTESGTTFLAGFNEIYYSFSPTVADWERHNPIFKETVKLAITPLLTTLSILNYVDIDSEAEMLGYGIGIILLNIGTYFVLPAFLIIKIRGTVKF